MKYKHMDFNPAVNYLAERYNIELPKKELHNKPLNDWQKKIYAIKQNPKKEADNYLLHARNLPPKKLPYNSYYYDSYADAVIFFDKNEQLINKKLINPKEGKTNGLFEKGSNTRNAVYVSAFRPEKDDIYFCEKPIDALSLYVHDFSAISLFSSTGKLDIETLTQYIKNKNVILAFDADDAGDKAANYYSNLILDNIEVKTLKKFGLGLEYKTDINDLQKKFKVLENLKNPDRYEYIKYPIATIPLVCNTYDIQEFEWQNKFYVKNSRLYQIYRKNEKETDIDVSDCNWSFLYRIIDANGDATHLIKVQRFDKEKNLLIRLFEANTDEIQKDKFEKKLNNLGFTFYGSANIFNKIKLYNLHNEKEVVKIEKFGYHPDFNLFFWSNSAVSPNAEVINPNEFGIITHNEKSFYLETASSPNIGRRKLAEQQKFSYKKGNMNLKTFISLLIKAYGHKAVLAFSYFVSSVFRDIVFSEIGRFPNLYLYGPPGTGKSKFAEFILGAQGDYTGGYSLTDTTQSSFSRIVDSRINSLVYLKEYNSEIPAFVDEFLKTAYEGQGRTIGVKSSGNEVISYQSLTGILIDANFLPINQEAVFTRMIILDFKKTKFSKEEIQAYEALDKALKEGLSQIATELLGIRKEFEKLFKNHFNAYFKLFKKNYPMLKDRAALHSALLYTVYQIIKEKFELNIEDNDVYDEIANVLETLQERQDSFSHAKLFWDAFAIGIKEGKIQLFDGVKTTIHAYFTLKKTEGFIALRSADFKIFTQIYSKYCNDLRIKPLSPKMLKEELTNKDYFIENTQKSRNTKFTHVDSFLGSSLYFKYQKYSGNILIVDNTEIEINL